jgi:uncharacterized membrane protein
MVKTSKTKNQNNIQLQSPPKNANNPVTTQALYAQFSSPLPPPELLQSYEHLLPGTIERIIKLAETQSIHRQKQEDESLNANIRHLERTDNEAKRGQWFAFILVSLGIIGAVICAFIHAEIVGSIIGGASIVTVALAFINGRFFNSKNNKQSQK